MYFLADTVSSIKLETGIVYSHCAGYLAMLAQTALFHPGCLTLLNSMLTHTVQVSRSSHYGKLQAYQVWTVSFRLSHNAKLHTYCVFANLVLPNNDKHDVVAPPPPQSTLSRAMNCLPDFCALSSQHLALVTPVAIRMSTTTVQDMCRYCPAHIIPA